MKGYFISDHKAEELGLIKNPKTFNELQKSLITITETDLNEYQKNQNNKNLKITRKKLDEISNWFYSCYYDNLMETISNF
jgi:hypothetical protein